MALGGGAYLPPVVAELVATNAQFVAKIMESKALLDDFAKSDTEARIGATDVPLVDKLSEARVALAAFAKQVANAQLGADAVPFWSDIAELKALLETMSPLDIRVDADLGLVFAKLAELRGLLALEGMTAGGGGLLGGGGGGGGRAGAGAGIAGMLGLLGFKQGGVGLPLGMGAIPVAKFGSLAGLAGFGIEHYLTTVLGLMGSLAGAGLGGAALGGASLGVMGVGMGSDLAVAREGQQAQSALRSGILDSKNATEAQKALGALEKGVLSLTQATTLYGAAAANAQYQTTQMAIAMDLKWLKAIGPALVQLDKIKQSLYGVANTFIPLVASAAQRNFGIINTAIQPLFAFLKGPGTVIFQDLENVFAARLPIAIDAFTQGLELILKTIDVLAPQTGGFIRTLDGLLTKFNSPTGFAKWISDIQKLIGIFHVWEAFGKAAVKVIFDLFSKSAGLGTGIISTLTGMLNNLDKWINSTKGSAAVKGLFQAHKDELIAILKLLPALGPLAQLYIGLATPLSKLVALLATALGALEHIPGVGPILEWGLAIGILASRLKVIGMAKFIIDIGRFIAEGKLAAMATKVWTAMQWLLNLALDANPIGLIVIAIALLVAGVILAYTHIKVFRDWVNHAWEMIKQFGGWLGTTMVGIWHGFTNAIGTVLGWVKGNWPYLLGILTGPIGLFIVWLAMHKDQVLAFFKALPGEIAGFAKGVFNAAVGIGGAIVNGIISGLKALWGDLVSTLHNLAKDLPGPVQKALDITSPSRVMAEMVGKPITQGIAQGILASANDTLRAMSQVAAGIRGVPVMGPRFVPSGSGLALAAGAGGGQVTLSVPITINVTGAQTGTPQGIAQAVQRVVHDEMMKVVRTLNAGAYSIPGQS